MLPQGIPLLPWYFISVPLGLLRPPKPFVEILSWAGRAVHSRFLGRDGSPGLRAWWRSGRGGRAVAGSRSGRLGRGRSWGGWFVVAASVSFGSCVVASVGGGGGGGACVVTVVAGSGAGLASTGGLRIALAGSSTSTPTLTGTVPVRVVEKWMPLGSDVVSEGVFLSKWAILPCSIVGSGNQLSKTVVVILMVLVGMQASYS